MKKTLKVLSYLGLAELVIGYIKYQGIIMNYTFDHGYDLKMCDLNEVFGYVLMGATDATKMSRKGFKRFKRFVRNLFDKE